VRKGSDAGFNQFIECLKRTGQGHVASDLLGDGAVTHLVAKINVEDYEESVVEKINALGLKFGIADENSPLFRDEVKRLITKLQNKEITLLSAKKGNNIELRYFCKSLSGVSNMYDMYFKEELKDIMQELFIALLKTEDATSLRIYSLPWVPLNFLNFMETYRIVRYSNCLIFLEFIG